LANGREFDIQGAGMSSITDLADLIAANRARLERTFDGELARLRVIHGSCAVDAALRIVEQVRRSEGVEVRGRSE
jgi:hypothetical protein